MNVYSFIDLFAGIGGIRIAFERAGGLCVFSSEWDKYCQETYQANFKDIPHGDITQIEADDVPDHDILTAGFPCQPFSLIGKREGFKHSTQGTLFFDILRILKAKQPKAFLLENVSGLYQHDKGQTYRQIITSLKEELGYWVDDKILDAVDFGVPQYRKRIYIVGFHPEIASNPRFCFEWPKAQAKNQAQGIGCFIEDNPQGYSISEHLQKTYLFKVNDGRPQIIDKNSNFPVKTLVSTYHKIQRLTGTFVRGGETGLRLLTVNECKAIMGFPSSYQVPVSRTQMYRQFGNSVAIPVVETIAKQMTATLERLA
jgi:DNA (cytosine-5)-methyltransferase 1